MKAENNQEIINAYLSDAKVQSLFSKDFLPYATIHTFKEKEMLTNEGEAFPYLYYLVSGKAKVFMTHKNGKVSLINFLTEYSLIGDLGLVGVETQAKGIQAMEDCVCIAFSLKECGQKLLQDVYFLQQLCKTLGERTLTRTKSYAKNSGYPLENRLAAFILLTEKKNSYSEKHTEASDYLNVSYRHLLYVLKQFCEKGWLKKDGRNYWLQNKEQLKKLADELE